MLDFSLCTYWPYYMYRITALCLLIPLLSACEDPDTISNICANNSSICSDLNNDKWCSNERDSLIRSRQKLKSLKTETSLGKNQYLALLSLNNYQACINIAATIEPKKNIHLKSKRVEALISTFNELSALEKATKNSDAPYLLYYHWQYKNDKTAKIKLLAQSGNSTFNTAELQFALANIYNNKEIQQTIMSLLKGITFIDKTNTQLLTTMHYSLITAFMHEKKYKLGYLWSKIAINQGIENINLSMFQNTDKVSNREREVIDKLAIKLADKIADDEFSPSVYDEALAATQF